jgi:hypothetical protein
MVLGRSIVVSVVGGIAIIMVSGASRPVVTF